MKWGVIGTGTISNDFSQAIKLAGGELYAVGSRSAETAQAFAQKLGFEKAHASYAALLADPGVEVVYIGTPHNDHYRTVIAAFDAGKHVVCEKPLCWSLAQTEAAVAKAREAKLFLMEAMWTRFFPITKRAKRAASEEIGEVVHLNASFGFRMPANANPRLFEKELAGGAVLDVGVYPIAWTVMLLGRPAKITASGQLNEQGTDSFASAQFVYESGAVANIQASIKACLANELVVSGTEGTVRVHTPFHCPEAVTVTRHADDADALQLRAEQSVTRLPHNPPLPFAPGFNLIGSQGMVHEVRAVHDAISGGLLEAPDMPLDDTLAIAAVMEEVLKQVGVEYPAASKEI